MDVTLTDHQTMRSAAPSRRQLEVLRFIVRHVDELGYPPVIREIGRALGIASTSAVDAHLTRLAKRGLVVRNPIISRGLLVTAAGRREAGILASTEPASGLASDVRVATDAVVSAAERLIDPVPDGSIGTRWESLSRAVNTLRQIREAHPEAVPA